MNEALSIACALDPILFWRIATGLSSIDDWQRDLLLAATVGDESKILALVGRQGGKSRIVSVAAAWRAIFGPHQPALVLVASGSQKQSIEMGSLIFSAIHLADPSGEMIEAENMSTIRLRTGGRVICAAQSDSIRGVANVGTLLMDEAQLILPPMWAATEPAQAVAKDRKLLVLGTATSRATKFYEHYKSGTFRVFEKRSDQCPRISKEFLAEKRKSLGEILYAAEFENRWIEDGAQAISDELLEAAIDRSYVPLQVQIARRTQNV
jgi:hypothetical protein